MGNFNWPLFTLLLVIATLVGYGLYMLPSVEGPNDSVVMGIVFGGLLIVAGVQDLFD